MIFGKRKIKKLIENLDRGKHFNFKKMKQAAEELRKIGSPAIGCLIEALKRRETDLKMNAARILGEIGDNVHAITIADPSPGSPAARPAARREAPDRNNNQAKRPAQLGTSRQAIGRPVAKPNTLSPSQHETGRPGSHKGHGGRPHSGATHF